ncbi:hypothetical protein L2750_04800 [Shewanella submarina]|uniref:FlgO family outer membrane protein n=1 Tax=Shewanella submarina TaxID=2016376 RepID=A0ABV7GKM2_9GAMM|nr:FlgO family outer membrane protein [Shewanella submarina]MCL1036469.1 hypothetical protein [Shewanella submarina]
MFKQMKLLPLFVLVTACASEMPDQAHMLSQQSLQHDMGKPPKSAVNHLASRAVFELMMNNDALRPTQPVVVATPVMVGDFNDTNALGKQLQQGMMAALHINQFNVVDMNVAEAMRVTKDGNFILSRDWRQLPGDVLVEYSLVSTMSLDVNGLQLNSRLIDLANNRVVSASQAFASYNELGEYLMASEKVVSENGLLYRYEKPGRGQALLLGDEI